MTTSVRSGTGLIEHLFNLRKVFQRFWEARLKLNLEKCQRFQKEVRNLEHAVSLEEIITNPEKLKAVWEWLTTKNKHEIRSFLGLCTCHRWFIPCFANVAKPTHRREASLLLDSISGGRLPNTNGGPLYCPYSCLPAAKKEVRC
jgi:hypothetical protein